MLQTLLLIASILAPDALAVQPSKNGEFIFSKYPPRAGASKSSRRKIESPPATVKVESRDRQTLPSESVIFQARATLRGVGDGFSTRAVKSSGVCGKSVSLSKKTPVGSSDDKVIFSGISRCAP